jgi:peptidoglycan/LPS O-acetylase OafA/YrhL
MSHIPALDGLRALAVGLVLWTHFWPDPAGWTLINRLANSGWIGVDVFFVLSGFLITRILVAAKDRPAYFRHFYARRAVRIFPLYYALLAFVLVLFPLVATLPAQLTQDRWLYVAYLSNIALAAGGWQLFMLDITWSLAIEEQFYMLWPAVVRYLTRRRLLVACLAVVVCVPLLRLAAWDALGWRWLHMMTPFRMDALALGGVLALVQVSRRLAGGVLSASGAALVALIALDLFARDSRLVGTVGYSLTAITAGAGLVLALDARWLSWAPLRWIGIVSYGVYLLHPICLQVASIGLHVIGLERVRLTGIGFVDPWLAVLVPAALSVGLAAVSYVAFERPFLGLKRYFVAPAAPLPVKQAA